MNPFGKRIQLLPVLTIALMALFLSACSDDSKPVKGFVLPDGDLVRGEQLFVEYKCHSCHTIPDKEFPETTVQAPFVLEIGGEVYRVKNYGELMTAVVNPDHIISGRYKVMLEQADRQAGLSPMPEYSEEMTVAELIDLVAFLHAQYSRLQPNYYRGHYLVK